MTSGVYERVKGTQLRDPFDKLKNDIASAITNLENRRADLMKKAAAIDEEVARLKEQQAKLNKVME